MLAINCPQRNKVCFSVHKSHFSVVDYLKKEQKHGITVVTEETFSLHPLIKHHGFVLWSKEICTELSHSITVVELLCLDLRVMETYLYILNSNIFIKKNHFKYAKQISPQQNKS